MTDADLGGRLRDRIYEDVAPDLAEAIARARDIADPTKQQLDATYEMALVMLYRLLFIAYAEDEEFLPRRRNERYAERSLKRKARDLHAFVTEGGSFDSAFTDHWDDVMRLSRAIHRGHDELGLPAYDGRLLSEDPDISAAGARLAEIRLDNAAFGPVLVNLLIDETEEGVRGPVDFRNIGVREFGVIYEGLLESELSVADEPLGLDPEGRYEPVDLDAEPDREVVVDAGDVYLHGQSGERKATGTYYTKRRFVEHILEYSLEPALDEHIDRIDRLRTEEGEQAAAKAFFDLRVADIAMGSGHFLVGAVDRIESRLYTYLTEQPLAPIQDELNTLREAALDALPSQEYGVDIEDGQLLRRQVARRCIYGVELNPLATELARLSIWVHTFVPGLPLTFLEYNLVTGDSLAGIGTLDEVTDILDQEQTTLGSFIGGQSVMNEIRDNLSELADFADASAEQVQEARETRASIESRLEEVRARFDVLAASRIDDNMNTDPVSDTEIDIREEPCYQQAREVLALTDPLHFPAAFPEVFDGEQSGFDVIVGNPPWEEAMLQEGEFWMRYEPGLQGKTSAEQKKAIDQLTSERPDLNEQFKQKVKEQQKRRFILNSGPYPGMGTGNPDLYKGFCWRFWTLGARDGNVGVVLPRSAFVTAGSEDFRRKLLDSGTVLDLTFLKNKRGWVFDDVAPRYTIALAAFTKASPGAETAVPLRGPFPNPESFEAGVKAEPVRFPVDEAKSWTGAASFPLLPSDPRSPDVFRLMNMSPPLDRNEPEEWRAVPHRELHCANDREKDDGTTVMHRTAEPSEEIYWPVYKGASFNIWEPDTGVRYGWADPDVIKPYLQSKRKNSYQYAGSRSAFSEMPQEWVHNPDTLSAYFPRVAFRGVTRGTGQRTIISALVPPKCVLTSRSTRFIWPRGDEADEAYLLGILSSIPLDWYARRFIEMDVSYFLINAFPIPRVTTGESSRLRQRVIELSGRLAAVDDRYADWADAVGVEYGPLDEDTKQEKIYELDAVVAHLYGLTREHVEVIFETFHRGWDYEERLAAVLEYYDSWADRLGPGLQENGYSGCRPACGTEIQGLVRGRFCTLL
jgi:hypothetical protein